MKWLLKVDEWLAVIAHANLKFTQVSMDLGRHDVWRPEHFQTTIYRRLKKKIGILKVVGTYVQVGHDVIDCDLHRVVLAPMIVKHCQSFAEVNIGMLLVTIHKVSLHECAVELDGLWVQQREIPFQNVKCHMSLLNCDFPLGLLQCDFAHSKKSLDVVSVLRVLSEGALHVTRLDGLLYSILWFVLMSFFWDYAIRETFKAQRFYLRSELKATRGSFWITKWFFFYEQILVNQQLLDVLLVDRVSRIFFVQIELLRYSLIWVQKLQALFL